MSFCIALKQIIFYFYFQDITISATNESIGVPMQSKSGNSSTHGVAFLSPFHSRNKACGKLYIGSLKIKWDENNFYSNTDILIHGEVDPSNAQRPQCKNVTAIGVWRKQVLNLLTWYNWTGLYATKMKTYITNCKQKLYKKPNRFVTIGAFRCHHKKLLRCRHSDCPVRKKNFQVTIKSFKLRIKKEEWRKLRGRCVVGKMA